MSQNGWGDSNSGLFMETASTISPSLRIIFLRTHAHTHTYHAPSHRNQFSPDAQLRSQIPTNLSARRGLINHGAPQQLVPRMSSTSPWAIADGGQDV